MNAQQPDSAPASSGPSGPARQASAFTPLVTYVLLGFTILVYIGQNLSQSMYGVDLLTVYGAKVNQAILAGQLWRLVTPIFLHGSIAHIGFNMYALFILGPGLERAYGRTRYLLLYFISGIAGNVVSFYFSPYASIGASTSLFGLVSAEAVFIYRNRQFVRQARSLLFQLGLIVVVNLFFGLAPGTNIDNWGHLGGLVGGLAFAWPGGPLLSVGMMPTGQPVLMDRTGGSRAWVVALVETVVLVGLVVLRMVNA